MSTFSTWRQEWAQAVRKARDLPTTAKLVGQVLALDFANGGTGQCNPSRETIADHLGVSEATIKRALSDLVKAGWLGRTSETSRNKTVSYTFLSPGKVVQFTPAKAPNAGQNRPAMEDGTRVKSDPNAGQICTPPYKGRNQVRNQEAREGGNGTACPVQHAALIEADSHRETEWNAWLVEHRWPTVAQLGIRHSDASGVGWRMPFPLPPRNGDIIETRITEKFLSWASGRMIERKERQA